LSTQVQIPTKIDGTPTPSPTPIAILSERARPPREPLELLAVLVCPLLLLFPPHWTFPELFAPIWQLPLLPPELVLVALAAVWVGVGTAVFEAAKANEALVVIRLFPAAGEFEGLKR
jgi:hypothetical protein